ncbi:unnamed protein product [Hapterophycus canaliculatus]
MLPRALLLVRWCRPRPLPAQVAEKCCGHTCGITTTWAREARCFTSSSSPPSTGPLEDVAPDPQRCLREYIATLGVFFTLPEQGITSPEILTSRCSATPVRQTSSSPLRFLAAAHAVMPWAFPGYHDESHAWLSFLDETNVRYYAELRDPLTGAVLTNHELVNLAKHPSRDMAALGLKGGSGDDEDEKHDKHQGPEMRFLEHARSRGIPFSPLPLRRRVIDQADALRIVGYEVREQPGGLGQGEDPGMMMVLARGGLAARTAVQAFVETEHDTLNPGMCGAAVLDAGLELCGCVEGVVPTAPPKAEVDAQVRALQGMPCVVEWKDLDALLTASMDEGDAGDEDANAATDA